MLDFFLEGLPYFVKKGSLRKMKLKYHNIEVKALFFMLIILYQVLNSYQIVNNGNILTDGKWKCYYRASEKVCYKANN